MSGEASKANFVSSRAPPASGRPAAAIQSLEQSLVWLPVPLKFAFSRLTTTRSSEKGLPRSSPGKKDMCLVGEASNGRKAIEQLRSRRPDVTLMDLLVPEINGIERSRGPDLSQIGMGRCWPLFCSVENYGAGGDGSAVCTQVALIGLYVLFLVVRVKLY